MAVQQVAVLQPATEPAVMIKNLLPELSPPVADQSVKYQLNENKQEKRKCELKEQSMLNLLPSGSRQIYLDRFEVFKKFIKSFGLQYDEYSALMWAEYMREERGFGPSSMYSYWSAIKAVLAVKEQIYADNWDLMKKWLKNYADGKYSVSAPAFTAEQVKKFLNGADDVIYIRHKLALGLGLHGRLRAVEYTWLFHGKNDKEKILVFKS